MSAPLQRLMPHFLGIGAMRSGTSWLASHLGRHPEIRMRRKEIHFFDRKLERRLIPFLPPDIEGRLRYGLRFLPAAMGRHVFGEFTPSYAVLVPERIARVHAWMPHARILFIMRDPVERAWSQAKHDFLGWKGLRPEDAPRSELISFFDSPKVRRRGDYAACLSNWLEHYPSRQFFLTFLEDIAANPEGILDEAFRFLGVTPMGDTGMDLATPIHASPQAPPPDWVREYLTDSLNAQNERLEALVGRSVPWAARRDRGR